MLRTLSLAFCALALVAPAKANADAVDAATWLVSSCRGPAGTLTVRPGGREVSGYFGNIAALGLADTKQHLDVVHDWMAWYFDNARDSASGVDGIPDDRDIEDNGSFRSRGRPDSTDAYGATFLSLSLAAYGTADPGLRQLILTHRGDLLRIARSITATQQPDGLTWSRPQHHVKYAIDNQQVYRGLLDGAQLFGQAFHDSATAQHLRNLAGKVAGGLEQVIWDPLSAAYRPYVGASGTGPPADLSKSYPDALAQGTAIVYGVIDPRGPRAASLLARIANTLGDPNARLEDRSILAIAHHLAGLPLITVQFVPPDVCVNAGWYLILQSQ